MDQYQFLGSLMLRTPHFSYQSYALSNVSSILEDVRFKNALYLANPSLYQLLAAKQFKWSILTAKEKLTISRYYNRICFRPTPFGTFSSFSVVKWGSGGEQIKLDEGQIHLQLDQEVVHHLASGLTTELLNQDFLLNPTLYKIGREYRFIKTIYKAGEPKFSFSLESFNADKLTNDVFGFVKNITKSGIEIASFIENLSGCTLAEATAFFEFLVEAQILKSKLACNIIGQDYLERLLNDPKITCSNYKKEIVNLYNNLKTFQLAEPEKLIEIKEQVNQLLDTVNAESINQVFYAGLERKVLNGNVPQHYQQLITDGLYALQLLVPHMLQPTLKQFVDDFKNRYDRQKIPLLQAIDPKLGLGYGNLTNQEEPVLLKNIKFKNIQKQETTISWTEAHRLLFEKWFNNKQTTKFIELNKQDLVSLPQNNEHVNLPASFPVMFRILDDQVFMESVGGISANSLVGRFTSWNSELLALCKEIVNIEETANPDVVFAEIGQVSDLHADNINRRMPVYNYEIPVNAISTLPAENQISLSDLYVSVRNDQVVLESATSKKVIIPRLSSAYNFARNNLAVFKFLCDLQYQNIRNNFTLDLENFFPGLSYYPRVVYKQTILCLAKWNIAKSDIEYLIKIGNDFDSRFKEIRDKLQLPALVALARNDQQLVFNLDKQDEVMLLIECLKGSETVILQEFLIPNTNIVFSINNQPLINQFITLLCNKENVYPKYLSSDLTGFIKGKRDFIIGSNWVYLKIYCQPTKSDFLLVKKVLPLLKEFDRGTISSWFFVRYFDTGYHIRLRLKISENKIGTVLTKFKNKLANSINYQLIREYQADTYRPELERYGAEIIEQVEEFFYASSELIIAFIAKSVSAKFSFSYYSIAFVTVHYLLAAFLPLLNDQITFLHQMADAFYAEFSKEDKSLKLSLDLKYRELSSEIKNLIFDTLYFTKVKLTELYNFFKLKITMILKKIRGISEKRRSSLLADLIHMHLNRLFVEQPRKQELIVYYCLYKHSLSAKAVSKRVN